MENIIRAIHADLLAIVVLIVLIVVLMTSLILISKQTPVSTQKSWHTAVIPLISGLGLVAVIDLLQTGGFTTILSGVVLIALLLNIVYPILTFIKKTPSPMVANWYSWSIPIVIVGGLVVAGYLTYVEITAIPAVCGVNIPGCFTVQTSSYARLFGFLPVGLLGILGYVGILAAWIINKFDVLHLKKLGNWAVWGLSLFGVCFSTYLTYLEPFVIRATCSWCITSAIFMAILLWVTTPPVQTILIDRMNDDADETTGFSD